VICEKCTAHRECALCKVVSCRCHMETRSIRESDGAWVKAWCCADPFECMKRYAAMVIK
jgi:hypothetical protein